MNVSVFDDIRNDVDAMCRRRRGLSTLQLAYASRAACVDYIDVRCSTSDVRFGCLRLNSPAAAVLMVESRYVPLMMANSMSWRFFSSSSPSACCVRNDRDQSKSHPHGTHCAEQRTYRNQQLLHLLDGALELLLGAILGILDGDQHVQLVGKMLPVGLATVGILLLVSVKQTRREKH